MSILVTGGAGFIGSNFIHKWLECTNEKVINLDKLTYAGNLENLSSQASNPHYQFQEGDITNSALVGSLLAQFRPRAVLNFAAESHVDRSISAPGQFIETNIVGTYRLIEATRQYWDPLSAEEKDSFRFLHVSTDEVYGSLLPDDAAFTENHRYEPNSPYSASKASSDHLVRAYHATYGLPVLTTNCSNNYGPYQFPEKLIPLCIHNALTAKPLPIYGDGSQVRDWLFVRDHCSAIEKVLHEGSPGEVYNVGGFNEIKNIDVVKNLCTILDEEVPRQDGKSYHSQIIFIEDRPGHDRRYAVDASKIGNELNWKPEETFETGIRQTVRWYLENQKWVENVVSGEYRNWVENQYDK